MNIEPKAFFKMLNDACGDGRFERRKRTHAFVFEFAQYPAEFITYADKFVATVNVDGKKVGALLWRGVYQYEWHPTVPDQTALMKVMLVSPCA